MLVEEGLVDVQAAIDEDAVAKSGAGVDAEGAHATRGAVVDGVSLDAADLGDVDEFLVFREMIRSWHRNDPRKEMPVASSAATISQSMAWTSTRLAGDHQCLFMNMRVGSVEKSLSSLCGR